MSTSPESQQQAEWLYQHRGMLYGPVTARVLLDKVATGELDAATPVSRDGEDFRTIGEEPVFAVEVARITARLRVEAQAREEERRRRRRRILWISSFSAAAVLLALGAVRFVFWAEAQGLFAPDADTMAALEIQASLPTFRLEAPGAGQEEELLDYLEPERAKSRRPARTGRTATAATSVDPDGLATTAHYDQGAIQAVLAREQRSLFPCLQEQARRDPTFRGEVPFSFTIDNDGRVGRLWIDRPGLQDGPLFTCFRNRMNSWRFPPFQGERPSVSLSFRVGS